jgi:hypothetical protein
MKLATMITIATLTVTANISLQAKTSPKRSVTVYFDSGVVDSSVETPARGLASRMFSNIDIKVNWRSGSPARPEAGAIVVEFVTGTPATFKPGAMAYALPYEGVHIQILWDRIQNHQDPSVVLAHVMVHEITHILQGEARHSATGIMKANWSREDLFAMASKPLSFTDEDVDLIYRGMDSRQQHTGSVVAGAALGVTAAVGISEK